MDTTTMRSHLKRIEELVLDEENIVTYKFLSRDLGIHVNTAKQLLHAFLTEQQRGHGDCPVSATYLLAGLTRDGIQQVAIVPGNDLDEAYSNFDLVTSEHVYSVHKGEGASVKKNPDILFVADAKLELPAKFPIKHANVVERIVAGKRSEQAENTKRQIGSMQGNKDVFGKKSSPQKEDKTSGKKKVRDIGHYFGNQAKLKKVKIDESASESRAVESATETVGGGMRESNEGDVVAAATAVATTAAAEVKKPPEKRNKVKRDQKKRKRIVLRFSDSDTDEEEEDAMMSSAAEIPEDAEEGGGHVREEKQVVEEEGSVFQNKRKRKKLVDNVVFRPDGYLETTKTVVYETDNEADNDDDDHLPSKEDESKTVAGDSGVAARSAVPSKRPPDPNSEKTKPAKGALKQSSLLCYFKKK